MKKWISLFLVLCLCTILLPAHPDTNQSKKKSYQEQTNRDAYTPFLKAMIEDQASIWTSPFRIKKKDIVKWLASALITGILIANDEAIYKHIKGFQNDHPWVDDLSPKITVLGDGALNLGICGLFYLGGMVFQNGKAKDTAKLSLMSLLHASIVVQVLKHLAGRQRPSVDNGKDYWHGPSGAIRRYQGDGFALYDAFPSGHTITIWSVATVIAHMYNETPVVPVFCYTVATLAGLSRVSEDTHWLSDVFVGAVLGFAIARFVVKKRRRSKLKITPIAGRGSFGVSLTLAF
jgi:membrane-associated phospholipid phosphatase